ncbi:ABC transporter ATP-binding protein [Brachybacterium huguangmaarense]
MTGTASTDGYLLRIENLHVTFDTDAGTAHALDGVEFGVRPGEILCVVGESGSGKSVTAMSILRLLPKRTSAVPSGSIMFRDEDLVHAPERRMRAIRGQEIGMIFQDPMTALNPVMKVGTQIREVLRLHHRGLGKKEAQARAIELLEVVDVPQAAERVNQYPHQFSGGMRQRVMIAMAIANDPALIIADEPTTALDVTIQAQVLDQLRAAQAETGAATILITHDLGVVAEMAEHVVVMYAGRIMEQGSAQEIFADPAHPYTQGLMDSMLPLEGEVEELHPIPGSPPSLVNRPPGCPFEPRCALGRGRERCRTERPVDVVLGERRTSACHFVDEARARRIAADGTVLDDATGTGETDTDETGTDDRGEAR